MKRRILAMLMSGVLLASTAASATGAIVAYASEVDAATDSESGELDQTVTLEKSNDSENVDSTIEELSDSSNEGSDASETDVTDVISESDSTEDNNSDSDDSASVENTEESTDTESDSSDSASSNSSNALTDASDESDVAGSEDSSNDASTESSDSSDCSSYESSDATDFSSYETSNADESSSASTSASDVETAEFSYTQTIDGYNIFLSAEEGVLPADTEVVITKVSKTDNGDKVEDVVNDELPEDQAVISSDSFDISLYSDGQEVEPDTTVGNVNVSIELAESIVEDHNNSEESEVKIFHVDDDAQATEIDATEIEQGDDYTVEYDAESFSVYSVAVVATVLQGSNETYVNPNYEYMFDDSYEGDYSSFHTITAKEILGASSYVTDVNGFGEAMKTNIQNRSSSFTISFNLDSDTYSSYANVISKGLEIAETHTGIPTEGDYVGWAYYSATYQIGALQNSNGTYYGVIQFYFSYYDTLAQENSATTQCNSIISSLGLSGKSDYECAKAVYDYMIKNIYYNYYNYYHKYDSNSSNYYYYPHSSASAFVDKVTVCQGFALMYYRIMLTLGIDCRLMAGYANGGAHGWNIVQIGNSYYYVDSTWGSNYFDEYSYTGSSSSLSGTSSYNVISKRYSVTSSGLAVAESAYFLKGSASGFESSHQKFSQYTTSEFYEDYPISSTDYNGSSASSVPVTGLSLSTTSLTLAKGATGVITASITPSNATNQSVTFRSNDTNVATVTSGGVVTAVSPGVCKITVKTADGSYRQTCTVTVTDASGLKAAKKKVTVVKGYKYQLTTYIKPYKQVANASSLTYKSSNKKIATVSKAGVIKGKKAGTCKITIKDGDGHKVTVKVTVKNPVKVTKVKLNKKKVKLSTGQTYTLKATIKPKKATNKNVKWTSSNTSVATVDSNGNVTAIAPGKATITCKAKDGSKKKAKCKIIVK